MRAGLLNRRVTIEYPEETRGADFSDPEIQWRVYAKQWAAVEPLSGREYFLNRGQQTELTTRVRIRFVPGVTNKMRVVLGNRVFQIMTVIDAKDAHRELQLMCADYQQMTASDA